MCPFRSRPTLRWQECRGQSTIASKIDVYWTNQQNWLIIHFDIWKDTYPKHNVKSKNDIFETQRDFTLIPSMRSSWFVPVGSAAMASWGRGTLIGGHFQQSDPLQDDNFKCFSTFIPGPLLTSGFNLNFQKANQKRDPNKGENRDKLHDQARTIKNKQRISF